MIVFLSGCAFSRVSDFRRQVASLRGAPVVMCQEPKKITISVTRKSDSELRPGWSAIKIWVGRYPFSISAESRITSTYGGMCFDVPLVKTFKDDAGDETAIFEFEADPVLLSSFSDVILKYRDDMCWFDLPFRSNAEVLTRFKMRASAAEILQWKKLRKSKFSDDQQRAMEMVLFKLTPSELKRIGIEQQLTIPPMEHPWWIVAGQNSCDPNFPHEEKIFSAVLRNANCQSLMGNGRFCSLGWSVQREEFFRCRNALLQAKRAGILTELTSIRPEPAFKLK